MKQEPFVIECVVNAPAERVWKALTDKDQMKQWYFDIADFKPMEGFEFRFVGKDHDGTEYMHICKITEVIPNRKLSHSWKYEGYEGISYVTWELFDEGDSTRVKLTHEGLETFPAAVKAFARQNFAEGWAEIVGNLLKEYVELGTISKTIEINAPAEKVWHILTGQQYIKQWANAFGEGTYVETDWKKGSEVLWKDKEGSIGARGTVEINNPATLLKVAFYDDAETTTGTYTETYTLSENTDGLSVLSIEAGPLAIKWIKAHEPHWEKAVAAIKRLAEQ